MRSSAQLDDAPRHRHDSCGDNVVFTAYLAHLGVTASRATARAASTAHSRSRIAGDARATRRARLDLRRSRSSKTRSAAAPVEDNAVRDAEYHPGRLRAGPVRDLSLVVEISAASARYRPAQQQEPALAARAGAVLPVWKFDSDRARCSISSEGNAAGANSSTSAASCPGWPSTPRDVTRAITNIRPGAHRSTRAPDGEDVDAFPNHCGLSRRGAWKPGARADPQCGSAAALSHGRDWAGARSRALGLRSEAASTGAPLARTGFASKFPRQLMPRSSRAQCRRRENPASRGSAPYGCSCNPAPSPARAAAASRATAALFSNPLGTANARRQPGAVAARLARNVSQHSPQRPRSDRPLRGTNARKLDPCR